MSDIILKYPDSKDTVLTIRSRNAKYRYEDAEKNKIPIGGARYRFEGYSYDRVSINNNEITLKQDSDNRYYFADSCKAVFFDQTPYMFSIRLPEDTEDAYLFSISAEWCDSADWDSNNKILSVPINFGNDLGDFDLCWEWKTTDGQRHSASFSAQVYSTKLDIHKHFDIMIEDVKNSFNWIQLDLLRQTAWGWSYDRDSDSDIKTWLVIFQEVRQELTGRFRKIIDFHRKRLVSDTRMMRPEQMRKISHRLEEKIAEGMKSFPDKKYKVERKVLDADTPENRYIKHILTETLNQLNSVIQEIEDLKKISEVYKNRLKEWSDELSLIKSHRFWRGIGEFRGMRGGSLVLSQDPLYSGIRLLWFLLQHGLKLLEKELKGGIQNAAQLYEVWCLVKMKEIIENTGKWEVAGDFTQVNEAENLFGSENESRSLSVKITYKNKENSEVELDLLYQPRATKNPDSSGIWNGIKAEPSEQKPDIVLRLKRNELPWKPVYTWIFDAKYRLDGDNAPVDAVNEMHRYRDAILWAGDTKGTGGISSLTRESLGAFVLYPGDETKVKEDSYQILSVGETNIGAYPLRPVGSKENTEDTHKLIKKKIYELINVSKEICSAKTKEDILYDSVPDVKRSRIATCVICTTKDSDKEKMHTEEYWKTCRLYRAPYNVVKNLNPEHWGYIIPTYDGKQLGMFKIKHFNKFKRRIVADIYNSFDIKITDKTNTEDIYFLFSLDEPIKNIPKFPNLEKNQGFQVHNVIADDLK